MYAMDSDAFPMSYNMYPPLPAPGDEYLQRVADSRQKIAHVANPFIRDGTV